jgi:hypothetical protein
MLSGQVHAGAIGLRAELLTRPRQTISSIANRMTPHSPESPESVLLVEDSVVDVGPKLLNDVEHAV